ncbi:hypothetical protein [Mycolicibacterium aromaticivorans]|uniref:hypothetical protein n=1 Tax=Mycolicibacterium aromaticivorans TaxID=318425 RepID=UPI0012FF3F46
MFDQLRDPRRIDYIRFTAGHILEVLGVEQPHLLDAVLQQVEVKSARGAVPVFRPARFLGPLPAPAV